LAIRHADSSFDRLIPRAETVVLVRFVGLAGGIFCGILVDGDFPRLWASPVFKAWRPFFADAGKNRQKAQKTSHFPR